MRILVAATLVTLSFSAWSNPPSPSAKKDVQKENANLAGNKNETAVKRGTKDFPFVVETLPAQKSQAQADHEHYEHHEKPTLDRWLTYSTIVLAVVTAALAWFTFRLWGATGKLVVGADKTAERQLRAYLWVVPDVEGKFSSISDLCTRGVKLVVKNGGQTPAYGVKHFASIGLFESESDLDDMDFSEPGSKFVLNPGAESYLRIGRSAPLSADDLARINASKAFVYIWGEVRYKDAFKREQWTKFRLRAMGPSLMWCEEGNDAT